MEDKGVMEDFTWCSLQWTISFRNSNWSREYEIPVHCVQICRVLWAQKKQGSDGGCRWKSSRQEGGKKEVAAGSVELSLLVVITMMRWLLSSPSSWSSDRISCWQSRAFIMMIIIITISDGIIITISSSSSKKATRKAVLAIWSEHKTCSGCQRAHQLSPI